MWTRSRWTRERRFACPRLDDRKLEIDRSLTQAADGGRRLLCMPLSVKSSTPGPGTIRIGAMAKRAGLSPDTLRHYERIGILSAPLRSANGYRAYAPEALKRVQLVQRALACGFTLRELADALLRRDRGETPCRRVHTLAAEKLARMENELAILTERCAALRDTLADWDQRLAQTPRGRQTRLLDHIAPAPRRKGWTRRSATAATRTTPW